MRAYSRIPNTNHDESKEYGSSVTLVLYSISSGWWRGEEPLLNMVAAAAQFSSFTHVELAIGEAAGSNGKMSQVLRVFNDAIGVVR